MLTRTVDWLRGLLLRSSLPRCQGCGVVVDEWAAVRRGPKWFCSKDHEARYVEHSAW